MATQFYGDFSTLQPPLVIGGTEYGAAVRFRANPQAPEVPHVVCEGQLAADPTVPSAGYKRIVCARGNQTDSVTVTVGPGNVYEQTFNVLMGGNIAQTHEAARLYSQANDRAFRGGDSRDRVQPGDVVYWQGRGFVVTEATAFAQAPASVAWQSGEKLPTVSTLECDVNEVELAWPEKVGANRDAVVYFPEGNTGAFDDTGVFVWDGAAYVACTRTVFDGDAELYPSDASLSGAAYWIDPNTWELRLGSGIEATGTDLATVHWWRGMREIANGDFAVVLEGATGAGYGEDEDAVAVAAAATLGDGAFVFFVGKAGAGHNYGAGAVEWRATAETDAAVIALEWSGGTITDVKVRSAKGGNLASVPFVGNSTEFSGASFSIRITKAGANIKAEWSADNVTFTEAANANLTGVVAASSGAVGVAVASGQTARVQGWFAGATVTLVDLGGTATMSQQVVTEHEGVAFGKDWTLPAAEAVTAVELETIRPDGSVEFVAMTASGTGRDRYSLSGGVLTLTSETAGDRVRVTQAAPSGSYTGPGRPPRVAGTVNFATMSEVDGVGTTDVGENRAHWHDVLVVHDPHDELAATEGETFEVRRDPVFDSVNPPALEYDVKDGEGDWATLGAEHYLARWAEGLVLLTSAFLEGIEGGLCLRAIGDGYSQAGAMHARQVNDLAAAVEAFDGLWIALRTGAAGPGIGGGLPYGGINVGGSSTACYDCSTTYSDDHDWGQLRSAVALYADNGLPGYYSDSNYYAAMGSISGYTTAANTAVTSCGSGCIEYTMNDRWTTDDHVVGVNPNGGFLGNTTSYLYFGCEWPNWQLGAWSVAPVWYFSGVAIEVPEEVRRLPAGTECLAAWARVRVDDLERWDWELSVTGDATSYHWVVDVNGVNAQDLTIDRATEGVTIDDSGIDPIVAETSGQIGFTLVGARVDSTHVTARDTGAVLEIRNTSYRAFPGGTVTGGEIRDGEWCLVDVTNVVQALIDYRAAGYSEFFLWPGAAGVTPETSDAGLTAFTKTLFPERTVTTAGTAPNTYANYVASGSWTTFSALQINGILARFRLPGDTADVGGLGINYPAAMPEA